MKGADHILIAVKIHAGFSADTRVHLCEQRRRNLNHGNASQIDGGGEARQIADDASAKCGDNVVSVEMHLLKRDEEPLHRAQLFVRLSGRQHVYVYFF